MTAGARGNTCRGLTWGSSHYARFSNGARDRKSPAKPPRENPVNQSGSVALSAEEVRGPPQTQVIDKNSIFDPKLQATNQELVGDHVTVGRWSGGRAALTDSGDVGVNAL
jgi:hypothetical protein